MRNTIVQIALDDLSAIYNKAECADIYVNERDGLKKELETAKAEREAAEKKISELQKECEEWRDAKSAGDSVAAAHAFLEKHSTPFESEDAEDACKVIRQLLARKPEAPAPLDIDDERSF